MIKIKKIIPQLLDVFYKEEYIGSIESEIEFIKFRLDMIEVSDSENYYLKFSPNNQNWYGVPEGSPRWRKIFIDEFGIPDDFWQFKLHNDLLCKIIEQQCTKRGIEIKNPKLIDDKECWYE